MLTMTRSGTAAALLLAVLTVFAGANAVVSTFGGDPPPTLRRSADLPRSERLDDR